MILSFRALWSLSTRRGAFPASPRSEQQTLGQTYPPPWILIDCVLMGRIQNIEL